METVQVLLPLPLEKNFTYLWKKPFAPGQLVYAPWRSKMLIGMVTDEKAADLPKDILLKEATPFPIIFPQKLVRYLYKAAEYTVTPPGLMLKMLLSGFNIKKWESLAVTAPSYMPRLPSLEEDQKKAVEVIQQALFEKKYKAFLLDGVTGSGKTEVYFHALDEVHKSGKQALVLLPEISLTNRWVERFESRFGSKPLLWHSDQTPKTKHQIWKVAYKGHAGIFVGTRSALFLPYQNLGMIIVDEEHDGSFKQEEQVLYHARDMAVLKAHFENIPILLASATPSLESYENAQKGRYETLTLKRRFKNATFPDIHLIDRRLSQKNHQKKHSWIDPQLCDAIAQRLSLQEQSLLFLNRRGFAPTTLCKACGHIFHCPGCSASLVQHRTRDKTELLCHHCGFHQPLPPHCPKCETKDSFVPIGPGVERVFEEAQSLFPQARIATLTSDMTMKAQNDVWEAIYKQEVDMIVGTQLISKGHHISNLTLVGVIDADMGLMGSDLRACEKTFQLLQQVGGRAGREEKQGDVYLQTYQPDNLLFQTLKKNNREHFYKQELSLRKSLNLPPFFRLASLLLSGLQEENVIQESRRLANRLRACAQKTGDITILGPAPALMTRLKSRYRYRLLIKASKRYALSSWLKDNLYTFPIPSSVRLTVDIDPIGFY